MFQHFTIKNFRCFAELHLKNLARVNLIAGKNNTGKTALLEAIHLHSSPQSGQVLFEINNRRSARKDRLPVDVDACSWLFFDKEASAGLETISEDEQEGGRSFQVWIDDPASAATQLSESEKARNEKAKKALSEILQDPALRDLWVAGGPRLILRSERNGEEYYSIAFPGPWKGLPSAGHAFYHDYPSEFLASFGRSQESDAIAFSRLDNPVRQEELLQSLRQLEPRLNQLSVRYLAPDWVLHGKIDGLSRLVPVEFMGEGIRRLLSIVLTISTARKGGNILIDEVENGFHYSVLKNVWQAIGVAARIAGVQVFATTHSWECVLRAHEAFSEGDVYDMRLYRLDRSAEQISAVRYDQQMIETALAAGLEMRSMLPVQPPRPAPPAAPITLSKLLLVEGDTPKHFFEALLRHLGLSAQILVLDFRGIADLKTYLVTLTATPDFARLVTSVGVVRDAENDAVVARQSVTDALNAAGLTAARTPPIQTSIFILPDNTSAGMIETLCIDAVRNEPTLANAFSCVEEFFACLSRGGVALPGSPILAKNQAQAYLASRLQAQMFPGVAAYRGYWPWNNAVFQPLSQFLQAL